MYVQEIKRENPVINEIFSILPRKWPSPKLKTFIQNQIDIPSQTPTCCTTTTATFSTHFTPSHSHLHPNHPPFPPP